MARSFLCITFEMFVNDLEHLEWLSFFGVCKDAASCDKERMNEKKKSDKRS